MALATGGKVYRINRKLKKRLLSRRWLLLAAAVLMLVALIGVWRVRNSYESNLKPVLSTSAAAKYFTVQLGDNLNKIAHNLQNEGLIRSWSAFEAYVRINELRSQLQAGTYSLSPSMSTPEIADKIAGGDIAKNLVTILPGTRLDQIKDVLIKAGYNPSQADAALKASDYADLSLLQYLPPGHSLEGFLYPDSFQKNVATPASTIIRMSLQEMGKKLTPDIINGFKQQGLSVYQGVIVASIVEQESGKASDSPIMAQVFLLRLKKDIMLGSDVTARYASAVAGKPFSAIIKSPYNTRVVKGLPPGPIGTVTTTSLNAVAHPAGSSYLYFVTGDNGTTYYSYTQDQHNALVQKYCVKSCD